MRHKRFLLELHYDLINIPDQVTCLSSPLWLTLVVGSRASWVFWTRLPQIRLSQCDTGVNLRSWGSSPQPWGLLVTAIQRKKCKAMPHRYPHTTHISNKQDAIFIQWSCQIIDNMAKGLFLIFLTLTSHSISPLDKNSSGCCWEISFFSNNRKDQEFRGEIISWQHKDNYVWVNSRFFSNKPFFFLPWYRGNRLTAL